MFFRTSLIILINILLINTFSKANPTIPIITITINGGTPEVLSTSLVSYTANICTGQSIRLEASSTGNGTLNYEWKNPITAEVYGTDSVLEGALNPGQYVVTVTDDDGPTTSLTTIFICVTSIPPVNVTLNQPNTTTVCTSGGSTPIELTATATNQVIGGVSCDPTYKWFKDGTEILGENNSTLTITNTLSSAGTYTVNAVNACGETPAGTNVEVTSIDTSPTNVTVESSNCSPFICNPGSLALLASAENVDFFEWYQEGNPNPIGTGNSFTVTSSGNYTVRAINGCGETVSTIYTVTSTSNPILSSILPIFSFPSQACEGNSILLAPNVTGNPIKYEWFRIENGNDIFLEEEDFPFPLGFYTATEAGEYKVRVSNDCGEDEATINVNIFKNPTFVNIIPDTPPSFCSSSTGSTTLSAQSDGENLNYQWFKDGSPIGTNAPILTATEIGAYTVQITSTICSGTSIISSSLVVTNESTSPSTPTLSSSETETCDGFILLTSTDLGSGIMYEWRNGSTVIVTTSTPEYQATESGTYQVFGKNGCGDSSPSNTISLIVNETPSNIELNANRQTISCDGTSIIIYPEAQGTNLNYELFRDGISTGVTSSSSFSITESGEYTVEASNSCGSIMSSSINLVFTIAPSEENTELISTACSDPIVLSVQSSATNLNYEWYRNDVLVGTDETFDATMDGTYKVRVRNSCLPECIWIDLDEIEVIIGGTLNEPTIQSNPIGENNVCPEESIDLEAQVSNPSGLNLGYRWFRGNDLVDDTNTDIITVSETGNYYVEVYSIDDDACSQLSLPYNIFIRQRPELLLNFNRPLEFCDGDSVRLQINSQVPIPDAQYTWFKDDVLFETGVNSIFAKEAGVYKVEASYLGTEIGFPCTEIIEKSVTVETLEVPIPDITNIDGLLTTTYLSNSYQWNLDGIPILEANNTTFFPIDSGYYSITVFNELGCSGTSEEVFHYGVYPERDEVIRISPNPNNGIFRITIIGENQTQISIFDSQGKFISLNQATKVNSLTNRNEFTVEDLPKGTYIIRAEIDGNFVSRKVIVN